MRYKHKAFESLGITLRARDGGGKSQQQRKNGEALSVEKQTKWLLLLLSITSKTPHLYLLSTTNWLLVTFQTNPQRKQKREIKN